MQLECNQHFSTIQQYLFRVFTPNTSMAKKKQNKAKKLTIRIPPNQDLNNVESDNLDEPLEFPDSPVPCLSIKSCIGTFVLARLVSDNKLGAVADEVVLKAVLEFLSTSFITFNSKLL